MSPTIESTILKLKSGLKLEFKDDETVKVLRVSTCLLYTSDAADD